MVPPLGISVYKLAPGIPAPNVARTSGIRDDFLELEKELDYVENKARLFIFLFFLEREHFRQKSVWLSEAIIIKRKYFNQTFKECPNGVSTGGHQNDVRKFHSECSAIAEHCEVLDHQVDFANARAIDKSLIFYYVPWSRGTFNTLQQV